MSFLTLASLMLFLTISILLATSDNRLHPKPPVMGVNKLGMPIYEPKIISVEPGSEHLEWGKFLEGGIYFWMAWACFFLAGNYWSSIFLQFVSYGAFAVLLIVAYSIPWLAWENRYFRPRPDGTEHEPSVVHSFLVILIFAIAVTGFVYSCSTDLERTESSTKQSMVIEKPTPSAPSAGRTYNFVKTG